MKIHLAVLKGIPKREVALCGANAGLKRARKVKLDRHFAAVTCRHCIVCAHSEGYVSR